MLSAENMENMKEKNTHNPTSLRVLLFKSVFFCSVLCRYIYKLRPFLFQIKNVMLSKQL